MDASRLLYRALTWHAAKLVLPVTVLSLSLSLLACGLTPTTMPNQVRQIKQLKTPLATPTPNPASLTTYQVPSANTYLGAITNGPDNNLWFTEGDADKIAQITTAGVITEFPIATAGADPALMTTAPDGNIWFTEILANNIGRVTTGGVITEFPYPAPAGAVSGGSNAQGIAAGPDGNLWFGYDGAPSDCAGDDTSVVEVMSTSGVLLNTYQTPTANAGPAIIIAGPDGNMWFGEDWANKIGRITMSGVITEYQIPTPVAPNCLGAVGGMTVGSDGNIWFTERLNHMIGRITPDGTITEFGPFATGGYHFLRIITGPDGNLWFAEKNPTANPTTGIIGVMNTSGTLLAEYSWPNGGPRALAIGADNNIWYTDEVLDQVGRLKTGVISVKRLHRR